jgi:MarR family transcriptional regulator, organic hydroperoxide resistance regulator
MSTRKIRTQPTPAPFQPDEWPIAWMARIERQHARNSTAALAHLGIHHREFRVMAFLGNSPGVSVGELAELAVLERPTVSKMVDRLAAEGWVERGTSAQDGRRAPLTLTPSGRDILNAAGPIIENLFRRYQVGMGPEQTRRFVGELQWFFQAVQNPLGNSEAADSGER